jgi:hypothetical protein
MLALMEVWKLFPIHSNLRPVLTASEVNCSNANIMDVREAETFHVTCIRNDVVLDHTFTGNSAAEYLLMVSAVHVISNCTADSSPPCHLNVCV